MKETLYELDGDTITILCSDEEFETVLNYLKSTYHGYAITADGYDFNLMGVRSLLTHSGDTLTIIVRHRPLWLRLESIADGFVNAMQVPEKDRE